MGKAGADLGFRDLGKAEVDLGCGEGVLGTLVALKFLSMYLLLAPRGCTAPNCLATSLKMFLMFLMFLNMWVHFPSVSEAVVSSYHW